MINFVLNNASRETSSIALQVSFKGKQYKRSTGEIVPVKLWNNKKKRVKVISTFLYGNSINEQLDKIEAAALKTVEYFKDFNSPPSKETFLLKLDSELYPKDDKVILTDFITYLKLFINKHKEGKSISCVKKYTTTLNKLIEYQSTIKTPIEFKDINIDFYNGFRKWFFQRGYSTNYFGNTIKVIKQVYHEAKIIDNLHNFTAIEHKDFIGTREDSDNIYLSDDELRNIYQLDINEAQIKAFYDKQEIILDIEQLRKKVTSYRLVRDRFLIGAYTGLRVSDFNTLKDANIGEKFIRLRTKKTDTDTVIPMNNIVKDIIRRNDLSVSISDQKINKHIKDICKIVGINETVLIHRSIAGKRVEKVFEKWELVCTHTARRSFATNAYKAGVPTIAIMKITGHTKESTFLKYIKVSAEENAELLLSHPFFQQ